jgi:hypothetical protein
MELLWCRCTNVAPPQCLAKLASSCTSRSPSRCTCRIWTEAVALSRTLLGHEKASLSPLQHGKHSLSSVCKKKKKNRELLTIWGNYGRVFGRTVTLAAASTWNAVSATTSANRWTEGCHFHRRRTLATEALPDVSDLLVLGWAVWNVRSVGAWVGCVGWDLTIVCTCTRKRKGHCDSQIWREVLKKWRVCCFPYL